VRIDPAAVARAQVQTEGIVDENLREALNRLGSRIFSDASRKV
jgi:hypothetical protein